MRKAVLALGLILASCAFAQNSPQPFHLISGAIPLDKGPDGNSIVLDAPDGLIVVDTGRHRAHVQAILDHAKERGRPIAAIINSHWHLDHTTGNWDIRKAFPNVAVYASNALEGALETYLKKSREQSEAALGDPSTSLMERERIIRARAVTDHPERIRPNHVVGSSQSMKIAGRTLDVNLARFAASEGDVWLYDRMSRVAIVGDLVVDIVPFMDTVCPDGWLKALEEIGRTPFLSLVPGHGPVMDRTDFMIWKAAFADFIECGRSSIEKGECVAGWERGAAKFIDEEHRDYVRRAADYYLETRLRSSPQEQKRYCAPLGPGA